MSEQRPQTPSVGRVVHVVTFDGNHRPAFVIDPGDDNQTIVVMAFVTPFDHINSSGVPARSAVWYLDPCPYDATGEVPGSWHWPEFVAPPAAATVSVSGSVDATTADEIRRALIEQARSPKTGTLP